MLQTHQHHTYCESLVVVAQEDTTQSIQTKSLYHHQQFNAILLTIPRGHTLKEHVSPKMLTLHIIAGTGRVTVNNATYAVSQGTWFFIESNVPHELVSDQTLIVLLSLYTPTTNNGAIANE